MPNNSQLVNAIEYFHYPPPDGPKSMRGIANRFGVPPSTLQRAIKNGVPSRSGPNTILSQEEEQELVGYCINMQRLGFGLTRSSINYTILEMVRISGRKHP